MARWDVYCIICHFFVSYDFMHICILYILRSFLSINGGVNALKEGKVRFSEYNIYYVKTPTSSYITTFSLSLDLPSNRRLVSPLAGLGVNIACMHEMSHLVPIQMNDWSTPRGILGKLKAESSCPWTRKFWNRLELFMTWALAGFACGLSLSRLVGVTFILWIPSWDKVNIIKCTTTK